MIDGLTTLALARAQYIDAITRLMEEHGIGYSGSPQPRVLAVDASRVDRQTQKDR